MESSEPQLAAILFTDMADFTTLMDHDEMQAFSLQKQNRLLHQLKIALHNGILHREIGDGFMASFDNTLDAVQCALDLRDEVANIEGLNLRIGVHLGNVTFQEKDVFGLGVNIASRVQDQARIGQVLITNPVYDQISKEKHLKATYFAENILKNVPDPLIIYELNRN